jgi:hypothetical protein
MDWEGFERYRLISTMRMFEYRNQVSAPKIVLQIMFTRK